MQFEGKESLVVAAKHQSIGKWLLIAGILAWTQPGCNTFGLRGQLQQLEVENNRLLSEFRAERQRREAAERNAQELETRLAESEKLLARQSQQSLGGRLSSLPGSLGRLEPPPTSGEPGMGPSGDFRWQRRNN
jgi:hypothetical protein